MPIDFISLSRGGGKKSTGLIDFTSLASGLPAQAKEEEEIKDEFTTSLFSLNLNQPQIAKTTPSVLTPFKLPVGVPDTRDQTIGMPPQPPEKQASTTPEIDEFNKGIKWENFESWGEGRSQKDIENRRKLMESEVPRVSRNFKAGLNSSMGSTVRGLEWLAPDIAEPYLADFASNYEDQVAVLSVENPNLLDKVIQGAGSSAPFLLPGVGIFRGAAVLGVSKTAASILASSVSTAIESLAEAGGAYEDIKKQGGTEEQASEAAFNVFVTNAFLIGITNKLGLFSGNINSNLKRRITTILFEGSQEFAQQNTQNLNTGRPIMEGAWESGLIGAILGLPMSMIAGGSGATGGVDPNTMRRFIEEEFDGPQGPDSAGPLMVELMDKTDPNPLIDFKQIVEDKKVSSEVAEKQQVEENIAIENYLEERGGVKSEQESIAENIVILQQAPEQKPETIRLYNSRPFNTEDITIGDWADTKVEEQVKRGDSSERKIVIDMPVNMMEQYTERESSKDGNVIITFKQDPNKFIVFDSRETVLKEIGITEQKLETEVIVVPKEVDKAEAESNIVTELEIAEAGKRIPVEGQEKPVIQKTTFPQWIPSDLRKKPLLDAVRENILNNTVPTGIREKRLYDIVQDRIDEKAGIEKPKKKDKDIKVSQIHFDRIPPKQKESKSGVSSSAYYASKDEFAAIDVPEHITNIEMPELIGLTKELMNGEVPFLRRYPSAFGMFYGDPTNPRIGLNTKMFDNPDQVAKTLAHEIGHLIDFVPEMQLSRGNILNRLESLVNVRKNIVGSEEVIAYRKKVMNAIGRYNRVEKKRPLNANETLKRESKISELNKLNKELVMDKEYREELKKLSQFWKPFDPKDNLNHTRYRNSAPELYADFISVLFNRPDLAQTKAPKFFDRFFNYLDNKPAVKEAYFELSDFLKGPRQDILDKREADIRKGFQTAKELEVNKMGEQLRTSARERASNMARELNIALIEKNTPLIEKVEQKIKDGVTIKPEENPAILLEELDLVKNEISNVYDNVNVIDTKISKAGMTDADFSTYLFFKRVTGDRAAKANPYGHTPKTAQDGLNNMKEKLGKENFKILEEAGKELNVLMDAEMQAGVEAGLYSQELVDELQEGDNIYSTFKVLDYVLSGSVSANVMAQVGTFKDLGQTYQSTIAKMVAVRVAAHRNNFKKVSGEFFLDNFTSEERLEAEIPEFKSSEALQAKIDPKTGGAPEFKSNKNGVKLELVTWRDAGKIKGVYLDPYIASSFNYDTNTNNNLIRETVGLVNNEVFRKAYIDYSIRFIVRNPIRDLRQAWKALSVGDLQGTGAFKASFGEFLSSLKRAYPEARMFAKGEKTETIEQILDNKILGVEEDFKMTKEDADDSTAVSREMRKRGLRLDQIKKDKVSKNPFVHLGNFVMQVGKTAESITKIMAYQMIEEQLNMRGTTTNKQTAQYIRNNIGTPNWRKGGTETPTTNTFFMFSNVMLQGYKRTYHLFTNPNMKTGYMWRSAQIAILPKLLMWMAVNGLMGDDLEDMYSRVSTYKKRNYLVMPIGIHNGKAVTVSLPFDYDERLYTAVLWTVLDSIKNRSLDGADAFDLLFAEIPALTNTIALPLKWSEYFSGVNPRDNWTGRDVLTDKEFKSGGMDSLKPMMKWSWNQVLSGIFRVSVRDRYKDLSFIEKIANLPLINAFVSVEDYGLQEDIIKERRKIEKKQAKEGLKKDKIIIDKVREFYESEEPEANIDKYIGKAMFENFKGKMFSTSDETTFRKSFMSEYFKGLNNSYVTALIYANTVEEQASAIAIIKENADTKTFNRIQALFLNARLISQKTWDTAMEMVRTNQE